MAVPNVQTELLDQTVVSPARRKHLLYLRAEHTREQYAARIEGFPEAAEGVDVDGRLHPNPRGVSDDLSNVVHGREGLGVEVRALEGFLQLREYLDWGSFMVPVS